MCQTPKYIADRPRIELGLFSVNSGTPTPCLLAVRYVFYYWFPLPESNRVLRLTRPVHRHLCLRGVGAWWWNRTTDLRLTITRSTTERNQALEPKVGIGPTTSFVPRKCSTTELRGQVRYNTICRIDVLFLCDIPFTPVEPHTEWLFLQPSNKVFWWARRESNSGHKGKSLMCYHYTTSPNKYPNCKRTGTTKTSDNKKAHLLGGLVIVMLVKLTTTTHPANF